MDMETTTTTSEAAALRRKADACDARAAESFARSDTDGFLSQWASGLTAQEYRLQASILEAGGVSEFLGLFDAAGRRIKARLVNCYNSFSYRHELTWVCLDEGDHPIAWIRSPRNGKNPSARSKMGQLGLHEDYESAPAEADIVGSGTGLAGAASCYVTCVRTDGGFPEGAVVLERNPQ